MIKNKKYYIVSASLGMFSPFSHTKHCYETKQDAVKNFIKLRLQKNHHYLGIALVYNRENGDEVTKYLFLDNYKVERINIASIIHNNQMLEADSSDSYLVDYGNLIVSEVKDNYKFITAEMFVNLLTNKNRTEIEKEFGIKR